MEERRYRESRLCRLLGNPVVYRIVLLLAQRGQQTPSRLAKMTGRSVPTISGHLAKLRTADVVRYETAGGRTRYWLKHLEEMKAVLRVLSRAVKVSTRLR
ncbi:MAG: ArsR/SmtB family transcription factor [Candidatus Binatia bacterium]